MKNQSGLNSLNQRRRALKTLGRWAALGAMLLAAGRLFRQDKVKTDLSSNCKNGCATCPIVISCNLPQKTTGGLIEKR
jgi:hypothetical protein